MSSIVFIPIRSGSEGIPDKNIKPFLGKPLVNHVIEAGRGSDADVVVVSTNSHEYGAIAKSARADVFYVSGKRGETGTSIEEEIAAYIEQKKIDSDDVIILLQATSPYTKSEDINAVLDMILFEGYDSVVSVYRKHCFTWNRRDHKKPHGVPDYSPAMRPLRQEWEGVFIENGAIYGSWVGGICATHSRISGCIGLYEQKYGFELDTPEDWIIGEKLMEVQ